MNSEKITRVVDLRYIVLAVLFIYCWFSAALTAVAQNTQTTKNKADQNLKSTARVNPSTLAMEFSLPLGNYPGRGGNSMPVTFSYSSKVWNMIMFNTRFEMVDIPDTQYYHHIAYTNTEVSAMFAETSMAGWTSSLRPFQVIGGMEMYNGYGGIFQTGSQGGNYRAPGCEILYQHFIFSNFCESGVEWVYGTRCCNEENVCEEVEQGECVDFDNGGGGINPGGPTLQTANFVYRYRIEMPDGSTKEFRKDDRVRDCTANPANCEDSMDGTFLAVDSSGMRFEHNEVQSDNSVKDVLYLPDGSRYIFPVTQGTPTYGKLIDRNGNYSLYDSGNRRWTDTMGREFTDPLPAAPVLQPPTPGIQPVTVKGINNADITYDIEWQELEDSLENPNTQLKYLGPDSCDQLQANPIQGDTLFENQPWDALDDQILNGVRYIKEHRVCAAKWGGTPAIFNPVVMASITLPDESKYLFKYNEYGEITKITYPTGGYERFVYGHVNPIGVTALEIYTQGNRGVTKRYVSFDGSTEEQEWTYGHSGGAVVIIAPDGSRTERVLHESVGSGYGFEDPRNGMAFEERLYDTNGILRSRTLNDWDVLGPQGTNGYSEAKRDPRVKRSVSIMFDPTSSSALAAMSETDYDESGSTDLSYFSHLNVKQKRSYHYAVVNKTDVDTEQLSWTAISGWFTGKLAAVSETDYSYSSSYRARGIIGLPTESRALNPTNLSDVLSKSQPVYDEGGNYALINVGSTTGWADPGSNLRANVTTSRTWVKESNTWLETHAQYDNFGNRRKSWDASGDSSNFVETVYEHTTGNPYFFAYPTKVIAPAPDPNNSHGTNQTSAAETTYDFTTGLVLSVKDDFGQITTTEYDSSLRPKRLNPVVVNGVATGSVTETDYGVPVNGQLPGTQRFIKVKKQIDANNWDEGTTWFDGMGRTIKTVAKDSQGDVTVDTHYDAFGRVDRVTSPYRAGDSVYWSKTRFDEAGRAVESYAPETLANLANAQSLGTTYFGISTVTNYVGTFVTSTDASGRKGRSITNALGQLLRVDEPTAMGGAADDDLGAINLPSQPTYYKYDLYGNIVQVTQGVQNRYFKYDSLGRLIRVRQPEQEINTNIGLGDAFNTSGQWTAAFTYDVLGNVVTATDAKHVTIANTYDRAGRVTTRGYYGENPANLTPPVYFFYDGKGLGGEQTPNYAKGKLTNVSNGISETRYKLFDNFGRLKEMEQRTPVDHTVETPGQTAPRISKYTYNLSGALIEEEYPSGRKVKNEFESDGDLKRVYGNATSTAAEQTYANSFSYTSSGGISQMKLGNGKWETAQFNSRQQVTQLGLGTSAADVGLWKVNYEYGELENGSVTTSKNTGNIAKQTLTIPSTSFSQYYKYDPLYRLAEAKEFTGTSTTNPNWTQTFGYDLYGNRTSFSQNIGGTQINTTPAVSASTNRFTSTNFTYDKNGNITADIDPITSSARQFTFNGDNKQIEVNTGSTNVGKYYYDGEGKRVKKVTDTETTIFVYSGGKLVAEYATQISATPTISYMTGDHLGSPRIITDKIGNVKSRRDFMPFGEDVFAGIGGRTGDTGQKYSASTDDIRQKFTGYQKDSETLLDFAEARMYSNQYGRFSAVDPLLASGNSSNPQTFNRYTYVGNNPLTRTDPNGLTWYYNSAENRYDWYSETSETFLWGKGGMTNGWTKVENHIYYAEGAFVALDRHSEKYQIGLATPEDAQGQIEKWLLAWRPSTTVSNASMGPGEGDSSGMTRLTFEFFSGTGPEFRQFGPNTFMTNSISKSPMLDVHRQRFSNGNGGSYDSEIYSNATQNYPPRFGHPGAPDGPWNAGTDSPRQFVGSFNVTITEMRDADGKLTGDARFEVRNPTSFNSFAYGSVAQKAGINVPLWNRPGNSCGDQWGNCHTPFVSGAMGRTDQVYWWVEKGVIKR